MWTQQAVLNTLPDIAVTVSGDQTRQTYAGAVREVAMGSRPWAMITLAYDGKIITNILPLREVVRALNTQRPVLLIP